MQRYTVPRLLLVLAGLSVLLGSCDPSEIIGDCMVATDRFTGSYGPTEQKVLNFRVGCAGNISISWRCPECADPGAGLLVLLDPLGSEVLRLEGAGFNGRMSTISTLIEGQWTLLVQGTGGGIVNNYLIDVTYPGL